jgi:hypothetical protein
MYGVKREWHWFDWITVSIRLTFYFVFIVSIYTDPEKVLPLKGFLIGCH